jgi:hypothetical protein
VPEISAPAKIPRSARNDNGGNISALQLNFLFFLQEIELRKALIPLIGIRKSSFPKKPSKAVYNKRRKVFVQALTMTSSIRDHHKGP